MHPRSQARSTGCSFGARGIDSLASSDASLHALGRIGEPEDVASMIDWLLNPEQGWITGQVFGADGGLSTVRAR